MISTPVKTRIIAIVLCFALQAGSTALAQQWADNGGSIYNANTGNVGIGTTGPASKLQVVTNDGTNNITNVLTLTHTTTGTATGEGGGGGITGPFYPDPTGSLTTGLKAYYKLDETSGSRVDLIGGHNLTDIGGVTSAAGKVNGAAQFTYPNLQHLRTPASNGSDLQVGDVDFTIAAWIYINAKGVDETIASQYDSTSGQFSWHLYYQSSADRFRFSTFNSANVASTVTANSLGSPSTATWYHVVAWHDRTTNTNNIRINNGTIDSTAANVPQTSNGDFRIGSFGLSFSNWNGRMDEVGFWKKILSDQEISDLYNNATGNTYSASGSTAGAPIGTGMLLQAENAAGNIVDINRISGILTTVNPGTETSALKFESRSSGGELTERMRISGTGNVGIGTPSPASRLHVVGDVTVTGNISAKYQDVAEWVSAAQPLEPGTVVVVDQDHTNFVAPSLKPYDTRVAGVVSSNPGIVLGEADEGKVKVATTGRVRVRVDASRAPIRIGDLLVTSDKQGVAMLSEAVNIAGVELHRPGTLIGKALEPLPEGESEILVLLSLQ